MTCFGGLNLKKSQPACSIQRHYIDISFGPNGAPLSARWWFQMIYSAHSIALLLASFDVAPPSERENPSWIDWMIEISPSIRLVLLGWFLARMSRFRVSHHSAYCARRSLTSYRPVVHTCFTSARAFAAATCRVWKGSCFCFYTNVLGQDCPRYNTHTQVIQSSFHFKFECAFVMILTQHSAAGPHI